MLNSVILMGRMVKDPELRRTNSGIAVTSFTLAVERDYKDADGEKQTDFIDCVIWRSGAEFVAKYFTRGQQAAVSGRLQIRSWQDREGNKRKSAEVVADNVYFAGGGERRTPGGAFTPRPPDQSDFAELEESGELPF